MNKSVLPSKYYIPILGDVNVLSKLLILNIEFILFRGPFACFENNWHLKEDYKRATKRNELASQLSRHIAWFALLNLLLAPIIFLWQLLFFFFSYAAVRFLVAPIVARNNFNFLVDFEEGAEFPGHANLEPIRQTLFTPFQRTRSRAGRTIKSCLSTRREIHGFVLITADDCHRQIHYFHFWRLRGIYCGKFA